MMGYSRGSVRIDIMVTIRVTKRGTIRVLECYIGVTIRVQS